MINGTSVNVMSFSYAAESIEEEVVRKTKEKAKQLNLEGKAKGQEPCIALRLSKVAFIEFQNKLAEKFLNEYKPFIGLVKASKSTYFSTKLRFELEELLSGHSSQLIEN